MARASKPKKPAKRRRKPKQDRARALVDAILTATAQILRAEGSAATTTNKIAVRAGVSVGSLYQYFPNKTALYTALAERHVATLEASLAPLIQRFVAEPEVDIVALVVETLLALNSVDAPLHAELQRLELWGQTSDVLVGFRQRAEALIAEVLTARAETLPRPLDDPELVARVLVRAIGGVLDVFLDEQPEALGEPALVDNLTRLVAAYLGYP